MKISVIIPTRNEAGLINPLVKFILTHGAGAIAEVIVADGSSDDDTVRLAQDAGAIVLMNSGKSRATQMNAGAKYSTGEILYFVHADVKLIPSFVDDIKSCIENAYDAGCYRYVFDSSSLMLKINGYCTRFGGIMCRGGDQTIFVTKAAFIDVGGFNPVYSIMEDYDFIIRLRKKYRFKIIPKNIVVSARKYETNSWLRVQLANLSVFMMFFSGQSPEKMKKFYNQILRYR
jgi:rSAM/selenodomain-associated transferase 2